MLNRSSYHLIGLVLNFPENTSDENNEAYIRNASRMSVVAMILSQWGLQWVCFLDLQDQYPSPSRSLEWVDFQFSGDFSCLPLIL